MYAEAVLAAERLIYLLKEEQIPQDEMMQVFVLIFETKNNKLIPIALNCYQKLVNFKALDLKSVSIVLQHLLQETSGAQDLQLKILQTILPLVSHYPLENTNLADALLIAYRLQDAKGVVAQTAQATFRQMIVSAFEKQDPKQDALLIFQDLFTMTAGQEGQFLKKQTMSRTFGLELLELVISSCPKIVMQPEMLKLVKEQICPLVIKLFSEKPDFYLYIRLFRLSNAIIKHFNALLIMPCEIFMNLYNKILIGEGTQVWQAILVLESYKSICADPTQMRSVYESYDQNEHVANCLQDIVHSLVKVLFEQKDLVQEELSTFSCTKLQFLELLDKQDPPQSPVGYPMLLATQALNMIVENQAIYCLPPLQTESESKLSEDQILSCIALAKMTCYPILISLSLLSTCNTDEELFQQVLLSWHQFSVILGLLGLTPNRDAFLGQLCRLSVPGTPLPPADLNFSGDYAGLAGIFQSRQNAPLTERHLQMSRTLMNVCQDLFQVMDNKTWFCVLECLQILDQMLSTGKLNKKLERMESSPGLLELTPVSASSITSRNRAMTVMSPPPLLSENPAIPFHQAIKKLFEKTHVLKIRQLNEFLRALCRLAMESMVGTGSVMTPMQKDKDEKSFAIQKILETTLLNMKRILQPEDQSVWDLVIGQWIQMAHSPTMSTTMRQQVMSAFSETILQAGQQGDLKDPEIETKTLEPLKTMMGMDFAESSQDAKLGWLVEVQKQTLETLNKLLQTSGQDLNCSWLIVMDVIQFVSRGQSPKVKRTRTIHESPILQAQMTESPVGEVFSVQKSLIVTRTAFPCIQLICTDFLTLLSPSIVARCIDVLSGFGSLQDDVNISLTAVGLLWSVCDFVLTKRHQIEKQSLSNIHDMQDQVGQSLDELDLVQDTQFTKQTMDTLWMHLLKCLSRLSSDERPEVRNSANQTLFRTINMNGRLLSLESWDLCLDKILLPLLDKVKPTEQQKRSKLWDETKIITLSGISKCLLDFLHVLVDLPRFEYFWSIFLSFIKTLCLDQSQEVSMAAFKHLKSLCSNEFKQPGMWTSVWQCWASIGLELVREEEDIVWSDGSKPGIIRGYLSQDCLLVYLNTFSDILQLLDGFTEQDKLQFFGVLRNIVLYYSLPPPDATQSKIRADFVNDLEAPSNLQQTILDLSQKDLGLDTRLDQILILSDFIVLPFLGLKNEKRMTFMGLSKKSILLVVGILETNHLGYHPVFRALSLPMAKKYDCPKPGQKDSTPLYKCACTAFMTKWILQCVSLFMINCWNSTIPEQSFEEARTDEDFDMSFVKIVQDTVLSHLSQPRVDPVYSQKLLGTMIQGALLEHDPKSVQDQLTRERLAFQCLDCVFTYKRTSAFACPLAIEHTKHVIQQIRNLELDHVLERVLELELSPGTLGEIVDEKVHLNDQTVKQYLMSGTSAHIYSLFPSLIDLLGVLSGSQLQAQPDTIQLDDEAKMADTLKKILKRATLH
ncbi:guanine nucleotide exchange factor in Golgi transport N-terminal-domain-containing protein [Gorgonomyces haynaldii]|nr:guanine nucleotide exchange factor in Golgi transport N-terminal-domain-containing protein [Gorgonomyces haynaldii]